MNTERLLKLADRIERYEELKLPALDMDTWFTGDGSHGLEEVVYQVQSGEEHWCGTTTCIAGHAILMMAQEKFPLSSEVPSSKLSEDAAIYLGLDEQQQDDLFHNYVGGETATDAAEVIRNLVQTGRVSWPDDVEEDDYEDED